MPRPLAISLFIGVPVLLGIAILLLQRDPPPLPYRDRYTAEPRVVPDPVDRLHADEPEGESPPRAPGASPARKAFDRLLAALRSGDKEKAKEELAALHDALVPDAVPDAENAAALYREAFEKWPDGLSAEEAELVSRLSEGGALTAGERAILEKALERGKEALALLHRAAALPRCSFGLDYSRGAALELPHIQGLIRASRLLELEALLGDGPAAARAAQSALRTAEAVSEEPILISQLVRGLCHAEASSAWQKAFEGDLPADALRSLLGSLSPERVRDSYERTILFELYAGVKFVLEGGDPKSLGAQDVQVRRPEDPLTAADLAHYAETLSEYAKLVGRPYYEVRDSLAELQRSRVDGAPWYAEITRLVMPAWPKVVARQASAEATLGSGQLAAALRLYRAEHGAYPGSIESLREVLPSLPVDPFTGRPYGYRREGSGFVVWSVGEDGLDGGGVSGESDVLFRSPR